MNDEYAAKHREALEVLLTRAEQEGGLAHCMWKWLYQDALRDKKLTVYRPRIWFLNTGMVVAGIADEFAGDGIYAGPPWVLPWISIDPMDGLATPDELRAALDVALTERAHAAA